MLTYLLLMGPLQKTCLQNKLTQMSQTLKKSLGSNNLRGPFSESFLIGALPIASQFRTSTLKRSRLTEKTHVKRTSTWITSPRKKPRALIELRGNLLSIKREKYGLSIYL